jgi:uncharacterized protein
MDDSREPPTFDYAALMRQAILDVVRHVLARVADEGMPGEHHFYLTFGTKAEGVEIPPALHQQFPEEMTIVLQHQFWNLAADDAGFAVTLRFAGKPERVRVPWPALLVFADPSVGFALKLPSSQDAATAPDPAPAAGAALRAVDGSAPKKGARPPAPAGRPRATRRPDPPAAGDPPKVVDFGAFRRRSEDRPQD